MVLSFKVRKNRYSSPDSFIIILGTSKQAPLIFAFFWFCFDFESTLIPRLSRLFSQTTFENINFPNISAIEILDANTNFQNEISTVGIVYWYIIKINNLNCVNWLTHIFRFQKSCTDQLLYLGFNRRSEVVYCPKCNCKFHKRYYRFQSISLHTVHLSDIMNYVIFLWKTVFWNHALGRFLRTVQGPSMNHLYTYVVCTCTSHLYSSHFTPKLFNFQFQNFQIVPVISVILNRNC